MRDGYLTFATAGNIWSHMTVGTHVHRCGKIDDGVAVAVHNEGGRAPSYIMEFRDLEAWYLAAKAFRESADNGPTER
jgi:hypothetical protein